MSGQHGGAQRLCRLRGAALTCRDANCREERINTVARHRGVGTASHGFYKKKEQVPCVTHAGGTRT